MTQAPPTENLAALTSEVDGVAPEWLLDLKRAAISRFEEHGFPTVHDEDWKYTDVSVIRRATLATSSAAPSQLVLDQVKAELQQFDLSGPRMVFVNGRFVAALSSLAGLPSRVRFVPLSGSGGQNWLGVEHYLDVQTFDDPSPFVALNTGLFRDGALLDFGNGVTVHEPIYVAFVSVAEAATNYPRLQVNLGTGSHATLGEIHVSLDGTGFTNAVTEIQLASGSSLAHCRLITASIDGLHVGATDVDLQRDASYRSLQIAAGSALARADLNVHFRGEGAECVLNGAYVGRGSQHIDNHTLIDHAVPRCTSRQLYKGIVGGSATAVFNGKVVVRPGAQKTDAAQTNKNLLLSSSATVDTKPQLEILADDVRCTHGATVGPPDDETLFYLASRGLNPEEATGLLAFGFALDVLTTGAPASLRPLVEGVLRRGVAEAVGREIPE